MGVKKFGPIGSDAYGSKTAATRPDAILAEYFDVVTSARLDGHLVKLVTILDLTKDNAILHRK